MDIQILNLIDYLKQTKDSDWCVNIVRSKTNQNCIFGHVFNFGQLIYPDLDKDIAGNKTWNWFEECIGTTYYVYDINDGKNKNYPQPTPKQRCINYLYNILLGFEKTTHESMSYEFLKYSIKAQS
jgi:hypothetical protein